MGKKQVTNLRVKILNENASRRTNTTQTSIGELEIGLKKANTTHTHTKTL